MFKKIKPYLIGLIISLLVEVLLFNFSSMRSLGNEQTNLTEKLYIENSEVRIDNIDLNIRNLYIDTPVQENLPIEFKVWSTDEGDYFEYPLGSGTLSASAPASKYVNVYGYGNTKSLVVYFEGANKPDFSDLRIIANVKRPLFFNIWRVVLLFGAFCFFYTLRLTGEAIRIQIAFDKNKRFYRIQKVMTLVFMLLWIVLGLYWSSSHTLFNEASKPHHQQYKELAQVLAKGQVYLDYEPSEGLKNAPNPYDTIYLQANGIDYRGDYAYYDGHYYVYFGIVPELLLYLPVYLLTGKGLPNHYAVFIFYALFTVGTFLLYREILRRFFDRVPYVCYILVSSFSVACVPIAYLFFTADLYSVPIMGAMAFTVWGLYLWMKTDVIPNEKKGLKVLSLGLGSLSMALVAGCRPQMLLFSFLAIPLLWKTARKDRNLFSKNSIGRTLAFTLPYVAVAILVMWYNYARFGNAFDFGATYSLTNNDMNHRGIVLERMITGLGTFLFQIPSFDGRFPFLHSSVLGFDYFGRVISEHFFGGLIVSNILTWPLLLIYFYRKEISLKKLWPLFGILLGSSLIIGLVDANEAGVLQRYASDMSLGIVICASLMLFMLLNFSVKLEGREYSLIVGFVRVGFVIELLYSFLVIVNTEAGITLREYNPELFYRIAMMFRF